MSDGKTMDLIEDANNAIESLNNVSNNLRRTLPPLGQQLDNAIVTLRRCKAELQSNAWIPVTPETEPNYGERVWVIENDTASKCQYSQKWGYQGDCPITHYRPLPPLPDKKGEEKT